MKKFRIDFFSDAFGGLVRRIYMKFENRDKAAAWALDHMPYGAKFVEVNTVA